MHGSAPPRVSVVRRTQVGLGAGIWQPRVWPWATDVADDAKLLSEVTGRKVDEVFIGSCMTNIGHFRAAGKMLEAFEGQLPTRLWVAPPTKMDAAQLTAEGYYSIYGKAGAHFAPVDDDVQALWRVVCCDDMPVGELEAAIAHSSGCGG